MCHFEQMWEIHRYNKKWISRLKPRNDENHKILRYRSEWHKYLFHKPKNHVINYEKVSIPNITQRSIFMSFGILRYI